MQSHLATGSFALRSQPLVPPVAAIRGVSWRCLEHLGRCSSRQVQNFISIAERPWLELDPVFKNNGHLVTEPKDFIGFPDQQVLRPFLRSRLV